MPPRDGSGAAEGVGRQRRCALRKLADGAMCPVRRHGLARPVARIRDSTFGQLAAFGLCADHIESNSLRLLVNLESVLLTSDQMTCALLALPKSALTSRRVQVPAALQRDALGAPAQEAAKPARAAVARATTTMADRVLSLLSHSVRCCPTAGQHQTQDRQHARIQCGRLNAKTTLVPPNANELLIAACIVGTSSP